MLIVHALFTVGIIYIACTSIELLRIKYLEKPVMNFINKNSKCKNICLKVNSILTSEKQEFCI